MLGIGYARYEKACRGVQKSDGYALIGRGTCAQNVKRLRDPGTGQSAWRCCE